MAGDPLDLARMVGGGGTQDDQIRRGGLDTVIEIGKNLLGPQVKYMLSTLSEKAASHGIPVRPIEPMDYGMQRGDKVLDFALSLIEAAH